MKAQHEKCHLACTGVVCVSYHRTINSAFVVWLVVCFGACTRLGQCQVFRLLGCHGGPSSSIWRPQPIQQTPQNTWARKVHTRKGRFRACGAPQERCQGNPHVSWSTAEIAPENTVKSTYCSAANGKLRRVNHAKQIQQQKRHDARVKRRLGKATR